MKSQVSIKTRNSTPQCCKCPDCGQLMRIDWVRCIGVSTDLPSDPILGEGHALRFLASRFTPEGIPLDPGGKPCTENACVKCRSNLPPLNEIYVPVPEAGIWAPMIEAGFSETFRHLKKSLASGRTDQGFDDELAIFIQGVSDGIQTCFDWISNGLVSEPVALSNDMGNLVTMSDWLEEAASQRAIDPTSIRSINKDHLNHLNRFYAEAADQERFLNSYRRRCLRNDPTPRRAMALNDLRENYPRNTQWAADFENLEPLIADWLVHHINEPENCRKVIKVFDQFPPITTKLENAINAAKTFQDERDRNSILSDCLSSAKAVLEHHQANRLAEGKVSLDHFDRIKRSLPEDQEALDKAEQDLQQARTDIEFNDRKNQALEQHQSDLDELADLLDERALSSSDIRYRLDEIKDRASTFDFKLDSDVIHRAEDTLRKLEHAMKKGRHRKSALVLCVMVAVGMTALFLYRNHTRGQTLAEMKQLVLVALEEDRPDDAVNIIDDHEQSHEWMISNVDFVKLRVQAEADLNQKNDDEIRTSDAIAELRTRLKIDQPDLSAIRKQLDELQSEAERHGSYVLYEWQKEDLTYQELRNERIAKQERRLSQALQNAISQPPGLGNEPGIDEAWLAYSKILVEITQEIDELLRDPIYEGDNRIQAILSDTVGHARSAMNSRNRILEFREAVDRLQSVETSSRLLTEQLNLITEDYPDIATEWGLLESLENSRDAMNSMIPVEHWRTVVWPVIEKGYGPDAVDLVSDDRWSEIQKALSEHENMYPKGMYQQNIEWLRLNRPPSRENLVSNLKSLELENLFMAKAAINGRAQADDDWVYARVVDGVPELLGGPDDALGYREKDVDVSIIVEHGLKKISETSASLMGFELLRMIDGVLKTIPGPGAEGRFEVDSLMRLIVLYELSGIWLEYFSDTQPELRNSFQRWRTSAAKQMLNNEPLVDMDWMEMRWATDNMLKLKREMSGQKALIPIEEFPPLDEVLSPQSSTNWFARYQTLRPLSPAGILLPAGELDGYRKVSWIEHAVKCEDDLVIPLPDGRGNWKPIGHVCEEDMIVFTAPIPASHVLMTYCRIGPEWTADRN